MSFISISGETTLGPGWVVALTKLPKKKRLFRGKLMKEWRVSLNGPCKSFVFIYVNSFSFCFFFYSGKQQTCFHNIYVVLRRGRVMTFDKSIYIASPKLPFMVPKSQILIWCTTIRAQPRIIQLGHPEPYGSDILSGIVGRFFGFFSYFIS